MALSWVARSTAPGRHRRRTRPARADRYRPLRVRDTLFRPQWRQAWPRLSSTSGDAADRGVRFGHNRIRVFRVPNPLHFDTHADVYDRARPPYPAVLWAELQDLGLLQPGIRAIDLGAGSGLATGPLLEAGASVDAVEPGPALADGCAVAGRPQLCTSTRPSRLSCPRQSLISLSRPPLCIGSISRWSCRSCIACCVPAAISLCGAMPSVTQLSRSRRFASESPISWPVAKP